MLALKSTESFNKECLRYEMVDIDDLIKNSVLLSHARRLTLYSNSGMNRALDLYAHMATVSSVDGVAIFARHNNVPIAWSLWSYEEDALEFTGFRKKHNTSVSHVFVSLQYRGYGIGSSLLGRIARMADPDIVYVYWWNEPSFFAAVAEKYSNIRSL